MNDHPIQFVQRNFQSPRGTAFEHEVKTARGMPQVFEGRMPVKKRGYYSIEVSLCNLTQ